MAKKDKEKKIKDVVRKLKETKNKLGDVEAPGVDKPKKIKPKKQKEEKKEEAGKKRKKTPTATMVGPRGGTFQETAGGQKVYTTSKRDEKVKKSLEEYFKEIEAIDNFISKFKHFKGLM